MWLPRNRRFASFGAAPIRSIPSGARQLALFAIVGRRSRAGLGGGGGGGAREVANWLVTRTKHILIIEPAKAILMDEACVRASILAGY